MERLLGAFAMTRLRVRICKCIDNALYLDERRWPRVAHKQWDGVWMLGTLVDEVYA